MGASWLVFALTDRGDGSHHAPAQTAALAVGAGEAARAAELYRDEAWVHGLLAVRLMGGGAMTIASARWLSDCLRR